MTDQPDITTPAPARELPGAEALDKLAQAQNVRPIADVRALFGTWPGEIGDGFEEDIDELRHSHAGRGGGVVTHDTPRPAGLSELLDFLAAKLNNPPPQ